MLEISVVLENASPPANQSAGAFCLASGWDSNVTPMTSITKRDLVVSISAATGLTQEQTLDVVQQFLDTVTDHVADGNEVVLRNFGAFQVKRSKPKVGRNPSKPDSEVAIPARTIVKFKPGKEMKDRVALLEAKSKAKGKKGK